MCLQFDLLRLWKHFKVPNHVEVLIIKQNTLGVIFRSFNVKRDAETHELKE